jgi:nitroreductase
MVSERHNSCSGPSNMNLVEAMHARRAVRSYQSRRVEEGTLRNLLHLAVHAPSARNAQPWMFAVVQDTKLLQGYSDRAKALLVDQLPTDPKADQYRSRLSDPAFNIFYDASTLVAIGVAEPGPYAQADCWLAAGALMLAATDAGLGTCPIGFAVPLLNTPDVKRELGFSPSGMVAAPIIVGYATVAPPAVPRHEPRIVSWVR